MNISYKERQMALFPEAVETPDESQRPNFMAARLTLSMENLVILSIVSIMVILFSFSLGVERGRKVILHDAGVITTASRAVTAIEGSGSLTAVKAEEKAPKAAVEETKAKVPAERAKDVFTTKVMASVQPPVGSGYTVQVASYNTEKSAQIEAASLKRKGFDKVYVLPKGKHIILCVGNFKSKTEAEGFGQKSLKNRYQDLRVRSL